MDRVKRMDHAMEILINTSFACELCELHSLPQQLSIRTYSTLPGIEFSASGVEIIHDSWSNADGKLSIRAYANKTAG